MRSKAKKTPAKKAKASAKASQGTKTKASKQSKSKSATGKKSKATGTATKRSSKVSKASAVKKGGSRKSATTKAKGTKAGSKKRMAEKPVETPVMHGTDQHFIPSHQSGTEMPHVDEKILHNREQAAMNQENQRVKNMVTRSGVKRVFRILGK